MSNRLADVSERCRGFWAVRHDHTQGRTFHNNHKYTKALLCYESTLKSAPGGKPDDTLLRDYGSALRGAGRYEESLRMLRCAADWFLRGGDHFQAARCESLLWRSTVESARHGGPGSFAECVDRLMALEHQEPGLTEKGNPLVHTQHRLGRLTALAAVPADREKAVTEALQLNKIIDNNNYYRQKFELIKLCAASELPVNLGPVPKTRRSRRQKA